MSAREELRKRVARESYQTFRDALHAIEDDLGLPGWDGADEDTRDAWLDQADRILALVEERETVVVGWECLFRSAEIHGESWEHEGLHRSKALAHGSGRVMVEKYGMDGYIVVPLVYARADTDQNGEDDGEDMA